MYFKEEGDKACGKLLKVLLNCSLHVVRLRKRRDFPMDLLGIAKLKVEDRGAFYDVPHAPSETKVMSNQQRTGAIDENSDVIHVRVRVESELVDLHIGVRSRGGNSALGSETVLFYGNIVNVGKMSFGHGKGKVFEPKQSVILMVDYGKEAELRRKAG